MHYTQEFLAFIENMKLYCRIKGQTPKEGTVLKRLHTTDKDTSSDIIYKIQGTRVVFSSEIVKEIKLDKFGIEISLKD